MRKINLLFFIFLIPVLLFSQTTIVPGWHLSFGITDEVLNRNDHMGVWKAKGGFDINNNGKKEIILMTDPLNSAGARDRTQDISNSIIILENDGYDNYKTIWSHQLPYVMYSAYGDFTVADVDKDGKKEIWVVFCAANESNGGTPNPPRLLCYEFDGEKMPDEPTLTWDLGLPANTDFRPSTIIIDDVDNDEDDEILILSRQDNWTATPGRTLLIANYIGGIEQGGTDLLFYTEYIDQNSYLASGSTYEMKVVDFDGDGKKEIWIFNWDYFSVNIIEAVAQDDYRHQVEIRRALVDLGDVSSIDGTCFVDMNGDDKLEAYIAGHLTNGRIFIIENIDDVSKLTVNSIKELGYRTGGDPYGACVGDFNNNGLMEFVFCDRASRSSSNGYITNLVSVEYKGTGALTDSASYIWTKIFTDISDVATDCRLVNRASDMDGDGYDEILLSNLDVMVDGKPCVFVVEAVGPAKVEKLNNLIPEGYALNQNYPNPFNPTTKIEFAIPVLEHVTLNIYNLLGQQIITLIDDVKSAGNYLVEFNASKLASGTYYYTITAGKFIESKKMLLIK
jgi:hypothetical protein